MNDYHWFFTESDNHSHCLLLKGLMSSLLSLHVSHRWFYMSWIIRSAAHRMPAGFLSTCTALIRALLGGVECTQCVLFLQMSIIACFRTFETISSSRKITIITIFVLNGRYNQRDLCVCVCVCLTHGGAVQNWLNLSRCRLGDWIMWAQATMYYMGSRSPRKANYRLARPIEKNWQFGSLCCDARSQRIIQSSITSAWQRDCCSRLQCSRLVDVTYHIVCSKNHPEGLRWGLSTT